MFVDPDGQTKLLDFGLARSFDDSSIVGANATVGHMLIGTPHSRTGDTQIETILNQLRERQVAVEQRATIDAGRLTPEQRDVLRAALLTARKVA